MITVKPEYIIPTFGLFIFDTSVHDFRTVQVGGTLPASDLETCQTALYVKYQDVDQNQNDVSNFIKINIPNDQKVFIHTSGIRSIADGQSNGGTTSVFMVPADAIYSREFLYGSDALLFQTTSYLSKDAVISSLDAANIAYTIESSVQANPTPYDFIA